MHRNIGMFQEEQYIHINKCVESKEYGAKHQKSKTIFTTSETHKSIKSFRNDNNQSLKTLLFISTAYLVPDVCVLTGYKKQ